MGRTNRHPHPMQNLGPEDASQPGDAALVESKAAHAGLCDTPARSAPPGQSPCVPIWLPRALRQLGPFCPSAKSGASGARVGNANRGTCTTQLSGG